VGCSTSWTLCQQCVDALSTRCTIMGISGSAPQRSSTPRRRCLTFFASITYAHLQPLSSMSSMLEAFRSTPPLRLEGWPARVTLPLQMLLESMDGSICVHWKGRVGGTCNCEGEHDWQPEYGRVRRTRRIGTFPRRRLRPRSGHKAVEISQYIYVVSSLYFSVLCSNDSLDLFCSA